MRGYVRTIAGPVCAVLALAGLLAPAGAREAGHDAVNFTNAHFRARESSGTVDIGVERGTHGRVPSSVEVRTYPGEQGNPAQPGSDYETTTDRIDFQTCCESREAKIPLAGDAVEEDLETVTLKLENPTAGMVRAFPQEALLSIVDDDGPSRVSFELAAYEVFENADRARVYVLRSGSLQNQATVAYETQDGTASAGDDYQQKSDTLTFPAGDYFNWIDIPLVDSGAAESSETFTVELTTGTNTTVTGTSTAEVTIHDEEGSSSIDFTPPYTAFHQPLHKKKYRPKAIRSFIAFMQDNTGGTGVKRVDLAIRMNRDDGSCRWWNGTRFRPGKCREPSRTGNKRWADTGPGTETKVEYFNDTAIFELGKALKGSGPRSDIRSYIAYCRGRDVAGNLQDNFDKGQNRNTFDVRGGG